MKKGKYIDYNILLACLSKKPQPAVTATPAPVQRKNIVEEFYEALSSQASWYPSGLARTRRTAVELQDC